VNPTVLSSSILF